MQAERPFPRNLTGDELVEKINHEYWFYSPENLNSLVSDAKFENGILSFLWAGFSEMHGSDYELSKAVDDGTGQITIFARISFQRLDCHGLTRGISEEPVFMLFDRRYFTDFPRNTPLSR